MLSKLSKFLNLPSLNTEFYGWIVREDYNGVLMWFSGNQLPPSMVNSSETNLKEKRKITEIKTKESRNTATSC